jgi:hypothetical protein
MPTLTQLQTALADTPNLSASAKSVIVLTVLRLDSHKDGHLQCEKTTLGELARAMQVETTDNGVTHSLTIENEANRVILQTPVIINEQNK